MRVINLALKDLKQIIRDRKTILFLLVMPFLFTIFFGSMVSYSAPDPRLPVGLIDLDNGSVLSAVLQNLLAGSRVIRPVSLDDKNTTLANDAVNKGTYAAVIVIPEHFSEQNLGGQIASLTVIADSLTTNGSTAHQEIQAAGTRLAGIVKAAQLSASTLESAAGSLDASGKPAYLSDVVKMAAARWQSPALVVTVEKAGGSDQGTAARVVPSGFKQSSPGIMAQFVVFGLTMSGTALVLERKTQTLQRLMTTVLTRTELIAGKVLAMFALVFVQEMILVVAGQFLFGVNYLREPLGTPLVMVVFALFAACLGLFIGVIARSQQQVSAYALIGMFALSALGGAWFPLEITGPSFAAVGHLTPLAWAIEGFQNIVVRGLGLSSVVLPVGVLLDYAVVFFGLAVWRFKEA